MFRTLSLATLFSAAFSLTAFAGEAGSRADAEPQVHLTYAAALVSLEAGKPLAAAIPNGVSMDSAIKTLAAGAAFTVMSRPEVGTVDGRPAKMSLYQVDRSAAALEAAESKGEGAVVEEVKEGYEFAIIPAKVEPGAATEIDTAVQVKQSVKVEKTASEVESKGSARMKAGDYQVVAWEQNGKQYAMLVQLSELVPAAAPAKE
ncbi:hypothetical protein [Geopseudomonas aromaticivorans]